MSDSRLPAWFGDRAERKRRNARTRKQEREHAKNSGGKAQPGSGSSWRAPGDVRTEETLDELKWTQSASYSLKHREWRSVVKKAHLLGREPRMFIDFKNIAGKTHTRLMIVEVPPDAPDLPE